MENSNQNKRVVLLVLICFGIYFGLSLFFYLFDIKNETLDKLNLISDIFIPKSEIEKKDTIETVTPKVTQPKTNFELYKKGNLITNFKTDSSCALPHFVSKLRQLKRGQKTKIRIAYFGDSMIEGDLLTQTLRKLLQEEFGGYGVGFVPMYSNVSGFRITASVLGQNWIDISFKDNAQNMYISGHTFSGNGQGFYRDNTLDGKDTLEISLIYGKNTNGSVFIDKNKKILKGDDLVNRFVVYSDTKKSVRIFNGGIPKIFGVSFESPSGVILDNFSFRGITGIELNKITEDFLKSIQKNNPYDLIVFQYGVNLMFRKNDTNYSYYEKAFDPIIKKFKTSFVDTDILMVSSADRAFRYNGIYKTAKGLPNLLKIQANLAFQNNIAFFNLFETMGGENSIVEWAKKKPRLANRDYIHPNHRGAEVLANKIFDAIMDDFNRKKFNHKEKITNE